YTKEGILVIQSQYFTGESFLVRQPYYVSKEKADELLRSNVQPDDIVIAKIGANFGACAIVPSNITRAVLSGNTMKMTVDDKVTDKGYIGACLKLFKEKGIIAKTLATQTAQPALTLAGMKNLLIPLPSLGEQREIASVLSAVNIVITALDQEVALLGEAYR